MSRTTMSDVSDDQPAFFISHSTDVAHRPSSLSEHRKSHQPQPAFGVGVAVTQLGDGTWIATATAADGTTTTIAADATESRCECAARSWLERDKPRLDDGKRDWVVTRRRLAPRHVAA